MNHCHKSSGYDQRKKNTCCVCVHKNSRRLICLTNQLKILYRAASKVFTGCLSSTPIPLLLIETQLTLLKITLIFFWIPIFWTLNTKHFHGFDVLCASSNNHLTSTPLAQNQWSAGSRRNPSGELLILKTNPSILARTINYVSPNSFLTPIKFTVLYSIPDCSCLSSSLQHEYAKNWLLSLLQRRYSWADRSVSSLIRRVSLERMPYYPNLIPSTLFICWTNCLQFHS